MGTGRSTWKKADKEKTAFVLRKGLDQFRVMPLVCVAHLSLSNVSETVLAVLQWDMCLVYLYDIIVVSERSLNVCDRQVSN